MAGVLLVVGFILWLILCVDWKGFRSAAALGGWVSVGLYLVLAVTITTIVSNPPAVESPAPAAAGHHGE